MDQLDRFVAMVAAAIAATSSMVLSLIVSKGFGPRILDENILHFALAVFLGGIFTFLLVFLFQLSAYLGINSSVKLRKFLLRRNFVEGLWAEAMLEESAEKGRELRGVTLLNVGFRNGALQVSGEVFCCDGSPDGSFCSNSGSYHDYALNYSYFGTLHREQEIPVGYGSILFSRLPHSQPMSFCGRFSGRELSGARNTVKVHGVRLSDAEAKDWLDANKRKGIVEKYAQEFQAQFVDFFPRTVKPKGQGATA